MDRSKSKSPGKNKKRSSSKSAGKKGRSKSSRKSSGGPKKPTYVEMIQTALMTLNERGGSSRQEIWKFINAKFPSADYKIFLVRLKKYSKDGGFIQQGKNRNRFKLASGFVDSLKRRIAKGMSIA